MQGNMKIDEALVRRLIAAQIPQWQDLFVKAVTHGGWDNRTFHLGESMLVRMPSAAKYALKVKTEQTWLPILAPLLPLQIPQPVLMGEPTDEYPWHWSVYRWIEGETIAATSDYDLCAVAEQLAEFLTALHRIDSTNGPQPGPDNFYRGGSLTHYDAQVRQAVEILNDKIDTRAVLNLWQTACATSWQQKPVWVHGDIAAGNLLVRDGKLSAVIDFGGMAVGDPACDLAIAWTLFNGESRSRFCSHISLDDGTWVRARAWTLWKALIIAAGIVQTNTVEGEQCWRIIDELFAD